MHIEYCTLSHTIRFKNLEGSVIGQSSKLSIIGFWKYPVFLVWKMQIARQDIVDDQRILVLLITAALAIQKR